MNNLTYGFGEHWSCCWHVAPENGGGHVHRNELPNGVHWPPLLHGFGLHGSLLSQRCPEKPVGHWQKHAPFWLDGWPPFKHGFGLHGSPLKSIILLEICINVGFRKFFVFLYCYVDRSYYLMEYFCFIFNNILLDSQFCPVKPKVHWQV